MRVYSHVDYCEVFGEVCVRSESGGKYVRTKNQAVAGGWSM